MKTAWRRPGSGISGAIWTRKRRTQPNSHRLDIIALFTVFYVNVFEQMIIWADQAEAEITAWPGTADLGMNARTRALLEDLRARVEPFAARAEAADPGPP